jgi:redox-sensitive bicupin YhaK (pirin superfamily)
MKTRTVENVFSPPPPHMVGDGFKVHNFFPSGVRMGYQRMSPFFLMDYGAKTVIPPSPTPRGVGPHPHRGFETVTLAFHGKVAHHDSAGNAGVIGEGDVQWMTAGSGVLHKEYHEEGFARTGGPMQMVQLWVNLPAKDKMTPPAYQEITRKAMGRVEVEGGLGHVEVVAGEVRGVKGPAHTFTPVHLSKAFLKAGAEVPYTLPESFNAALLVLEGAVTVNGSGKVGVDRFALLKNDGEAFTVKADSDAVVLVLGGEPIREPIASHGPFVMNTEAEIHQAVEDFHAGKFGHLD